MSSEDLLVLAEKASEIANQQEDQKKWSVGNLTNNKFYLQFKFMAEGFPEGANDIRCSAVVKNPKKADDPSKKLLVVLKDEKFNRKKLLEEMQSPYVLKLHPIFDTIWFKLYFPKTKPHWRHNMSTNLVLFTVKAYQNSNCLQTQTFQFMVPAVKIQTPPRGLLLSKKVTSQKRKLKLISKPAPPAPKKVSRQTLSGRISIVPRRLDFIHLGKPEDSVAFQGDDNNLNPNSYGLHQKKRKKKRSVLPPFSSFVTTVPLVAPTSTAPSTLPGPSTKEFDSQEMRKILLQDWYLAKERFELIDRLLNQTDSITTLQFVSFLSPVIDEMKEKVPKWAKKAVFLRSLNQELYNHQIKFDSNWALLEGIRYNFEKMAQSKL